MNIEININRPLHLFIIKLIPLLLLLIILIIILIIININNDNIIFLECFSEGFLFCI